MIISIVNARMIDVEIDFTVGLIPEDDDDMRAGVRALIAIQKV
jgi:hypothetical protein